MLGCHSPWIPAQPSSLTFLAVLVTLTECHLSSVRLVLPRLGAISSTLCLALGLLVFTCAKNAGRRQLCIFVLRFRPNKTAVDKREFDFVVTYEDFWRYYSCPVKYQCQSCALRLSIQPSVGVRRWAAPPWWSPSRRPLKRNRRRRCRHMTEVINVVSSGAKIYSFQWSFAFIIKW